MRRLSKKAPSRLYPASQRLIAFAREIVKASSRHEMRIWEQGLERLIQKQLKTGRQEVLDAALGQLQSDEYLEFDILLQTVEALSETCKYEHDGERYDVLLVAAPVLAWTRFSIPHGDIQPELMHAFKETLAAQVLAPEARVFVAPQLLAVDQLPNSHVKTAQVMHELTQILFDEKAFATLKGEQETPPFLADTRYLLAAVAVPEGSPVFSWQTEQNPVGAADLRASALSAWEGKAKPAFSRLLPGCHVELLLPGAFYFACRNADVAIRPSLVRAAVNFVTQSLQIEASDLRAVVAPFGELSSHALASEYRIGFARRHSHELLYGVVWPLYAQEGAEEEDAVSMLGAPYMASPSTSPLESIMQLLKNENVLCDCVHEERFPMEYCEDCGAPMFADHNGELVHAEMPEEVALQPAHLH